MSLIENGALWVSYFYRYLCGIPIESIVNLTKLTAHMSDALGNDAEVSLFSK
jgi:hypothetical protein